METWKEYSTGKHVMSIEIRKSFPVQVVSMTNDTMGVGVPSSLTKVRVPPTQGASNCQSATALLLANCFPSGQLSHCTMAGEKPK